MQIWGDSTESSLIQVIVGHVMTDDQIATSRLLSLRKNKKYSCLP